MASHMTSRRRLSQPSLATIFPLLLLLFTGTASAASAVLGIDFGSSFIKAAIVKPGTPLDIVPTKDSKRKEAAAIAFKPSSSGPVDLGSFPERLYGGDALALAGRYPGDVYTNLKSLLGLGSDLESVATIAQYQTVHPAISLKQEPGQVLFQSPAFNPKETPWTLDELLAMEFKNIRVNAEAMTGKGSHVSEAVITVPVFYTADERRAIERAADLAGINVLSLVSDGLAVGIDYTVKREFPNISQGKKPEIHMIFDMGATSTTATVLRFQGKEVKDIGRFNKTVQEVAVLGAGWDRSLGGDALSALIADHLVDGFTKKSEVTSAGITAQEIKAHGRTAAKLYKEADRARQVLSANSEVRSFFEGFYKDIDFSSKLTRTEFEDMASEFADRVEGPVKQALAAAKLTLKDLDSIILHGGAIRTPFVQKRLEALTGKDTEVRTNVNSDESAAFGAAFKAAGLSPSFRVKEIRDSEAAIYAAGITYPVDGKQKQQKLFVPTSQVGPIKQFTVKNLEDFEFDMYQVVGDEERAVLSVKTENLTASVAVLTDKYGCTKDEISTAFNIRLSPVDGLPEVVSSSVSCEVDGSAKAGGIGDSVKGLFGFGSKKSEQEPLGEEVDEPAETVEASPSSSVSSSSKGAKASAKAEADTKSKKHIETVNVKLTSTAKGLPQPSKEEIQRMRERLAAFDRSDKARIQREEALNILEAYTYKARDLLTDTNFETASSDQTRSEISALLASTSDWLYGEGSTATAEAFKTKLSDLKSLVEPVRRRIVEAAGRPDKLKALQSSLDQTKTLVDVIGEQIAKAASSASEAVLSSTSTSANPSSSTAVIEDDFADLEEPDTTTETTPQSSKEAGPMSPYTPEDLSAISTIYESVKNWLAEKTTLQETLSPFQDPAYTVSELEAKAAELNKALTELVQKKVQTTPKRGGGGSGSGSSGSSSNKKAKTTKSSKKAAGAKKSATESGGAATAEESGKVEGEGEGEGPRIIRLGDEDEMPSEEELLKMMRAGREKKKGEGPPVHEEL